MPLKEEKRFPYFSWPEQNRTERRDTHIHTLNIQKNKQMPVWCILGAIWGGSLHTKEHSLVCQVSVECRNRPWCLATDDDLIKWKGVGGGLGLGVERRRSGWFGEWRWWKGVRVGNQRKWARLQSRTVNSVMPGAFENEMMSGRGGHIRDWGTIVT